MAIIKIRTPEELFPFRKQFRFLWKEDKVAVFDISRGICMIYSDGEEILLKTNSDKVFRLTRFTVSAWINAFSNYDIFDVQNAVARASLTGYKKTDFEAIKKYL